MVVEQIKVGDKVRHYAVGSIAMMVVKVTGTRITCKFPDSKYVATYDRSQLDKIEETGEVR